MIPRRRNVPSPAASAATKIVEAAAYLASVMPEVRRHLAAHSVMFFAWYYLGLNMWDHQVRWAHEFLRAKRFLRLAPRGHGKSETAVRVLALWKIVHNRDIRILIVSKDIKLARKHVMHIRQELKRNARLIADYGKFHQHGNLWSSTAFTVIRAKAMKDPTLEAIGMGGSITGSRFDLIIADDPIDAKIAMSEVERKRMNETLDGEIIPLLEPWGAAWMIGTRKHFADIYSAKLKDPTWRCGIDKAIIRFPEHYEYVTLDKPIIIVDDSGQETELWYDVVIGPGDPGEVLAPECMDMRTLLLKRKSMGTVLFAREYQCECIDDETALFKLADLQACRDENLSYVIGELPQSERERYQVVLQGVDPALIMTEKEAQQNDRDFFVALTWGLVKDSPRRELRGFFRQRGMSPDEVITKVGFEYARFMPAFSAIETNAFGLIHHQNLVKQTGFHYVKHLTTGNKHDMYQGVPSLSVMFENRHIALPYRTDEDKALTDRLIEEFHGLGVEEHDDIVMGMWILDTVTRRWLKGHFISKKNAEAR